MSHEAPRRKGPPSAAQLELDNFWTKTLESVRNMTPNDLKAQADLPLARIKKIMKLDEDVRMISAEAPVVFSKAAEIFIHELTLRAWIQAEEGKRRTLQRSDIAQALAKCDMFDFLIDIVPREEVKPTPKTTHEAKPPQMVQESMVCNLQLGPDGTLISQPGVQAHQQLVQIPGIPGLLPGQQHALQTVQIIGQNGQLQTVALMGGGALGIPTEQMVNQGGGPQIVQLQQPVNTRPQSNGSPQSNTSNNSPQQMSGQNLQNVQILQPFITANGEVQHVPVQMALNPAQLQSFRSQQQQGGVIGPPQNIIGPGGQVMQLQQVNQSQVGASPMFVQQGQQTSNGP